MTVLLDMIDLGSRLFFEYHCNESHQSPDAVVWYRSHQTVTVLECVNTEYADLPFTERCDSGHCLVYKIHFDDGFEWCAFEDELLNSEKEYCRPDPPKGIQL